MKINYDPYDTELSRLSSCDWYVNYNTNEASKLVNPTATQWQKAQQYLHDLLNKARKYDELVEAYHSSGTRETVCVVCSKKHYNHCRG